MFYDLLPPIEAVVSAGEVCQILGEVVGRKFRGAKLHNLGETIQ